jgi:hypothetical protein
MSTIPGGVSLLEAHNALEARVAVLKNSHGDVMTHLTILAESHDKLLDRVKDLEDSHGSLMKHVSTAFRLISEAQAREAREPEAKPETTLVPKFTIDQPVLVHGRKGTINQQIGNSVGNWWAVRFAVGDGFILDLVRETDIEPDSEMVADKTKPCSLCDGRGKIYNAHPSPGLWSPCPKCGGSGYSSKKAAPETSTTDEMAKKCRDALDERNRVGVPIEVAPEPKRTLICLECQGRGWKPSGQINASKFERCPRCQGDGIVAPSAQDAWSAAMAKAFQPPEPSVQTVMEGIARWHQADPLKRRVNAYLEGHRVIAWVTILDPAIRTHKVMLFTPTTAEETHKIITDTLEAAKGHPNLEFANAKNRTYKFREDSGEIEL